MLYVPSAITAAFLDQYKKKCSGPLSYRTGTLKVQHVSDAGPKYPLDIDISLPNGDCTPRPFILTWHDCAAVGRRSAYPVVIERGPAAGKPSASRFFRRRRRLTRTANFVSRPSLTPGIDNRFPLHHLLSILARQTFSRYGMYGLARVAMWNPHDVHASGTHFLGWICTVRILYKFHNGR